MENIITLMKLFGNFYEEEYNVKYAEIKFSIRKH